MLNVKALLIGSIVDYNGGRGSKMGHARKTWWDDVKDMRSFGLFR